jgi:hypothetical protein
MRSSVRGGTDGFPSLGFSRDVPGGPDAPRSGALFRPDGRISARCDSAVAGAVTEEREPSRGPETPSPSSVASPRSARLHIRELSVPIPFRRPAPRRPPFPTGAAPLRGVSQRLRID